MKRNNRLFGLSGYSGAGKRKAHAKRKQVRFFRTLGISVMGFALLIAADFCIGNTYAWFFSAKERANIFESGLHAVEIVENFEQPDAWVPGMDVKKEVSVVNRGETDALFRVRYDEFWIKTIPDENTGTDKEIYLSNQFTFTDPQDPLNPTVYDAAEKYWNRSPGNTTPATEGPDADYWYDGGDGYYYYKYLLKAGTVSRQILDSVKLHEQAIYDERGYSYLGAEYTLTFSVEAVLKGSDFGANVSAVIGSDGSVAWTIS